MAGRTMFDKVWDQHVVEDLGDRVAVVGAVASAVTSCGETIQATR